MACIPPSFLVLTRGHRQTLLYSVVGENARKALACSILLYLPLMKLRCKANLPLGFSIGGWVGECLNTWKPCFYPKIYSKQTGGREEGKAHRKKRGIAISHPLFWAGNPLYLESCRVGAVQNNLLILKMQSRCCKRITTHALWNYHKSGSANIDWFDKLVCEVIK